jgi:hypothetical protein
MSMNTYGTYKLTPLKSQHPGHDPTKFDGSLMLREHHPKKSCCSYALSAPFRCLTLKLILFHVSNAAFAVIACTLLWLCLSLGISLIPVCCIGVLILRLMFYVVHFLSEIEVHLYNFIVPPSEHIYVNFTNLPDMFLRHIEGIRVSPSLSEFSRESVLAIFYFTLVKLPLAIASSGTSLILLSLAFMSMLAAFLPLEQCVLNIHDFCYDADIFGPIQLLTSDYRRADRIGFFCAGFFTLYLAVFVMHITSRLLCKAVKFFCCEYFATYSYEYPITP